MGGIGLYTHPTWRETGTSVVSIRYRYRGLPAAVLLPQFFLACGWLRAAIAHIVDGAWWRGEALSEFLTSPETDLTVGFYEPFLNQVVARTTMVTSAIVLAIEVVAGIFLALNIRPIFALWVGAFLNLQFILAGVANPSAFYLILAFSILQWHMERNLSAVDSWRASRRSMVFGGLLSLALLPSISTLNPETAMEDPALVLIFLSGLFAFGAWWTHKRIVAKIKARQEIRSRPRSAPAAPPSTDRLRSMRR